jgi:ABC-2 type transport system permease protein
MTSLSRFILSAWLSYKALFTWLNPWGYIGTRLVAPVALALLFGSLGQSSGTGVERPVVGGALLAIALASIYGVTLALANERNFGTLELRVIAPEGLLSSFFGKALPHVIDGLIGATLTLAVAATVFSVAIPASSVGSLIAIAVVIGASAAGMGLAAGAVALVTRDTWTAPNLADLSITLASGVFVAPELLPAGIDIASTILPVRRSVEAALLAVQGSSVSWTQLLGEIGVGVAWGLAGAALVKWMLLTARRKATLGMI